MGNQELIATLGQQRSSLCRTVANNFYFNVSFPGEFCSCLFYHFLYIYNDLVQHLQSNLTFATSTCHCYLPQTQARNRRCTIEKAVNCEFLLSFDADLSCCETDLLFSIKNSIIMFLKELSKHLVDNSYEFAIM